MCLGVDVSFISCAAGAVFISRMHVALTSYGRSGMSLHSTNIDLCHVILLFNLNRLIQAKLHGRM